MTDVLLPGVHNIMATPFLPDEELDLPSIGILIDYLVQEGCTGVLALGVLGEADRLTEDERNAVLRTVLEQAAASCRSPLV